MYCICQSTKSLNVKQKDVAIYAGVMCDDVYIFSLLRVYPCAVICVISSWINLVESFQIYYLLFLFGYTWNLFFAIIFQMLFFKVSILNQANIVQIIQFKSHWNIEKFD